MMLTGFEENLMISRTRTKKQLEPDLDEIKVRGFESIWKEFGGNR